LKRETESVQHVQNTQYLYLLGKIYKMQHLEGSGTPVLYIGRTVLKGEVNVYKMKGLYKF